MTLNKGMSVSCDASRMLATCEEERTSLFCFYSHILARVSDIKLLVLVLSVWVHYILMCVTLCVTLESTKGCRGGVSNRNISQQPNNMSWWYFCTVMESITPMWCRSALLSCQTHQYLRNHQIITTLANKRNTGRATHAGLSCIWHLSPSDLSILLHPEHTTDDLTLFQPFPLNFIAWIFRGQCFLYLLLENSHRRSPTFTKLDNYTVKCHPIKFVPSYIYKIAKFIP